MDGGSNGYEREYNYEIYSDPYFKTDNLYTFEEILENMDKKLSPFDI